MAPIQAAFQSSKEWQEIISKAYPPPAPVEKKQKKVKDKGTKRPDAKLAEAAKEGEATNKSEQQLPLR